MLRLIVLVSAAIYGLLAPQSVYATLGCRYLLPGNQKITAARTELTIQKKKITKGRVTLELLGKKDAAGIGFVASVLADPQVLEMSQDFKESREVMSGQTLETFIKSTLETVIKSNGLTSFRVRDVPYGDFIAPMLIKNQEGEAIGIAQIGFASSELWRLGMSRDRGQWLVISYHLKPEFWGRGYATEVVSIISEYFEKQFAPLGYDGIVAAVHSDNTGSRAVLERNSFSEVSQETPENTDVFVRNFWE